MTLGQRAVACKGWRWLPGMRILHGGVCIAVGVDGSPYRVGITIGTGAQMLPILGNDGDCIHEAMPDLSDPATLGCLLSLVRAAWDAPGAYVHHDSGAKLEPGHPWEVWCGDGSNIVGVFDTEAEALVAALESAP